jgi:phage gp36-like protein
MAVYRQVHVSFWNDAKVVEEMTPEDKYFYLYLLTNPFTTQIGIYQITKKQMAFDMGYSVESINALVDRFEKHHKIIKYNNETREIALLNWGKYNFNRGGKPVEDCVKKELKGVKDTNLIALVAEKIGNKTIKALFLQRLDDTSHDTLDDTSTIRGQEKEEEEKEEEKEKDKSPKKASKKKRAKENLCSLEDVESFVESQMASNPLPVNRKILVKYIDTIRLYRKTARISTNIIKKEWQKWQKFHPDVITYALWVHVEKHDDKPESYTLAIMRNTKEYEAKRGILILKNKAKEATKDEISQIQPGRDQTEDTGFEGGGYYDQFDIFA